MLNAVWVAVIIAAACWAVLVVAAVLVLIKLSRLITQTSATVSGLRENSDAVIARAHATIDATAGQLDRTDEITASMDQVAAGMAELTGRVTALAPLARLAAATSGTKLARVSAFVYGVRHAAELRAAVAGARRQLPATAGEAGRAAGVSSPSELSRGVPGGRPPGPAEAGRAAGVSSPSELSRGPGPGGPGVVPRESGAGGRPPGPAQPAGDPSGARS
ncbi:MAG: hypothetical protein ABR926_17440 [Streptosporangiaceae bacterium]|jgi:uncharacterized protein YoxC